MNCEEVTDLLPAYVLGALEPDEVELVEVHIRDCREHDEELVELRATVFALDRYREDLRPSPSPALAGRILQLTDQGSDAHTYAPRSPRPAFLPAAWRGVAALAAVLLLFGAGWVAAGILTGGGDSAYAVVLQGEGGSSMEVSGVTSAESVTVTMAGLERLPEQRSYQVWAIREDRWVSIGICNTNAEGWWHGDFPFQIQEGERVALTVEPAGGSAAPSAQPILRSAP